MERNAGQMIRMISGRMKANGSASLHKKNLTMIQSSIIRYLEMKGGRTTQKDIEDYMNVSHPTIVGIITRMENNGFLKCCMDSKDKRQKIVELTDSARAVSKEIHTEIENAEQNMLRGLSKEEQEELFSLLERVYRNVEECSCSEKVKGGKIR